MKPLVCGTGAKRKNLRFRSRSHKIVTNGFYPECCRRYLGCNTLYFENDKKKKDPTLSAAPYPFFRKWQRKDLETATSFLCKTLKSKRTPCPDFQQNLSSQTADLSDSQMGYFHTKIPKCNCISGFVFIQNVIRPPKVLLRDIALKKPPLGQSDGHNGSEQRASTPN